MPSRPDRISRIQVRTRNGDIDLPWDSREPLLDRLRSLDADDVVKRFTNVGTSTPVELDDSQKQVVIDVIDGWIHDAGRVALPDGLLELRLRLADDLE